METESTVAFKDLPAIIKEAYNKAHSGIPVKAATKIETAKGETMYEVEFKKVKK